MGNGLDISPIIEVGERADVILTCGYSALSRLICVGQIPLTMDRRPSRWSHVVLKVNDKVIAESTIDYKPFQYNTDISHVEKPIEPELLPESPKWPERVVEDVRMRADNGPQYNSIDTLKEAKRALLIRMPLTEEQRDIVLAEADRIIKEENYYNITGLVGALLTYWGKVNLGFNPTGIPGTLFCSDFAQRCVNPVKIDFAPGLSPGLTAPEHVARYGYCQEHYLMEA